MTFWSTSFTQKNHINFWCFDVHVSARLKSHRKNQYLVESQPLIKFLHWKAGLLESRRLYRRPITYPTFQGRWVTRNALCKRTQYIDF